MYRFTDDIDYDTFFQFPRAIIMDGIWASLPSAARAVYPVYLMHMNRETGLSYPDERSVSALAGVTEKTARAGRNALEGSIPGLSVERYVTRRGRRSWRLKFTQQPSGRGSWMAFHTSIMHGGNWGNFRDITPSAHALYPVLLAFSYFAHDLASDDSDEIPDYGRHSFEFCEAEYSVLREYSGLSRNTLVSAFNSLERVSLVEYDSENGWKVYRRPSHRFKCKYMNALLAERGL